MKPVNYLFLSLFWIMLILSSCTSERPAVADDGKPKSNQVVRYNDDGDSIGVLNFEDDSISRALSEQVSGLNFLDYEVTDRDNIEPEELAMLQEGDIVLRKGYGAVSDFIATYLNEDYPITHCAFVLLEGYAEPYVLHSESSDDADGMFVQPLNDFVGQTQINTLMGVRLKGSDEDRRKVVSEAKRLLAKQVPFDMGFDDYDTTKMYCAEMMRYVFKKVYNKDLLDERAQKYGLDVIHMRNFLDPENFDILFNHFERVDSPWRKGEE